MGKCDNCFIFNNKEFDGMECCATNCNDVKKWLADHGKQIINKYRDKVKEDISARLKARKHYLTDDEYEHEVEATRNMISALDYFAEQMKESEE